jgi:glutaredoxin
VLRTEFDRGIVLLSGPRCPACEKLETKLKKEKIKYQKIDVSKEIDKIPPDKKRGLLMGIPQVFKDGKFQFYGVPGISIIRKLR